MTDSETLVSEAHLKWDDSQIQRILSDATLSSFQKKLALLPYRRRLNEEKKKVYKTLNEENAGHDRLTALLSAAQAIKEWVAHPAILQQNDHSSTHRAIDAGKKKRWICLETEVESEMILHDPHVFVVQNDWASAFSNELDFATGQFKLPYEQCVFEFRISNRNVVALTRQDEELVTLMCVVEHKDNWATFGPKVITDVRDDAFPFFKLVCSQIRAIAIALDAEVAHRQLVRASTSVNEARAERGKPLLLDYHLVYLAHRSRADRLGVAESSARKRLHFRRGHWRHFAAFKTWVRWTLVGNPELGFVDKEYRL